QELFISLPANYGVDGTLEDTERPASLHELVPGRIVQLDAIFKPVRSGAYFRFAGHEYFAVRDGFIRSLNVGNEAPDFPGKLCFHLEEIRIHHDREHVVGDPLRVGIAARSAGHGPGQHLHNHAQTVTLVAAEGNDGAGRRAIERLRIAGRLTISVEQTIV